MPGIASIFASISSISCVLRDAARPFCLGLQVDQELGHVDELRVGAVLRAARLGDHRVAPSGILRIASRIRWSSSSAPRSPRRSAARELTQIEPSFSSGRNSRAELRHHREAARQARPTATPMHELRDAERPVQRGSYSACSRRTSAFSFVRQVVRAAAESTAAAPASATQSASRPAPRSPTRPSARRCGPRGAAA